MRDVLVRLEILAAWLRPGVYFYWDDEPSRRLRPEQVDSKQALQAAKTFARSVRDKSE